MIEKSRIKAMALSSGFKLKEQPNGEMDLNPYVYEFAKLLELAVLYDRNRELTSSPSLKQGDSFCKSVVLSWQLEMRSIGKCFFAKFAPWLAW